MSDDNRWFHVYFFSLVIKRFVSQGHKYNFSWADYLTPRVLPALGSPGPANMRQIDMLMGIGGGTGGPGPSPPHFSVENKRILKTGYLQGLKKS